FLIAQRLEHPVASGVSVRHRLERGEGLGTNNEQCLFRAQVTRRFDEIGAVDIRNELERDVALAVVFEPLVRHDRPEVGATDANVDYISYAFPGMSLPPA